MMGLDDGGVVARPATPMPISMPCNILVVDDDGLIRSQLVTMLKRAGYRMHSAGSGAAALLALELTPCEIVLTDWEMPFMDGPSLCRALKLRDGEPYTYVMMLSVRNSPEDILIGLGAGVDDYLVKGAPIEQLLARIEVGRAVTSLAHSVLASGPGRNFARRKYAIN